RKQDHVVSSRVQRTIVMMPSLQYTPIRGGRYCRHPVKLPPILKNRDIEQQLMSKFTVVLTTAALLAFNVSAVSAQEAEIIALGDGSTITVEDYLLETSDTGPTTIVVRARP